MFIMIGVSTIKPTLIDLCVHVHTSITYEIQTYAYVLYIHMYTYMHSSVHFHIKCINKDPRQLDWRLWETYTNAILRQGCRQPLDDCTSWKALAFGF